MEHWAGRTALVTGASDGIGKAITIDLLKHGMNVVACARRVDKIEAIKEEVKDGKAGRFMAVKCDVGKEEEILAMFEMIKKSEFKGVDICVNSAGFGDAHNLSEGKTEVWRNMLNVNVLGLSICTREAIKSMKERNVDDGHVIHISSIGGHTVHPMVGFYCATKFAVRALTEGLRQELEASKSGIRVTAISTGLVKTGFADVMMDESSVEELFKVRHHMTAEDVSSSVMHALSAPKHVQVHDILIHPIGFPQ